MHRQPTSAPWQPLRLLQTVAFFQLNPFLRGLRQTLPMLESLIPSDIAMPSPELTTSHQTVLVIDAIQGTQPSAQRLQTIQTLLQRGYGVRAPVANLAAIPPDLTAVPQLTWVPTELSQPETIAAASALFANVSHLILCLPDGQSTHNSPELKAVLQLIQTHWHPQTAITPLFDFRQPSPAQLQIWGAVDDVVMGGVSESGLQRLPTSALFTGNVSTANSGGFVSVRTQNFQPALNLRDAVGIELHLRGDGNRYKFFIRTDPRWDGVGYASSFDTVADSWITLRLPFADFIPVFRAKRVPNSPSLNPEQIYALQLMLSKFEYDRQLNPQFTPGHFALEIAQINAYYDLRLTCLIEAGEPDPALVSELQTMGLAFQWLPFSVWEQGL
jgi:Complex I intermediate-associated protein 30 (CIA30)